MSRIHTHNSKLVAVGFHQSSASSQSEVASKGNRRETTELTFGSVQPKWVEGDIALVEAPIAEPAANMASSLPDWIGPEKSCELLLCR